MSMNLFVPITKVDVAKQMVYGRAVQEVVDRVGEIFDYTTSKPHIRSVEQVVLPTPRRARTSAISAPCTARSAPA